MDRRIPPVRFIPTGEQWIATTSWGDVGGWIVWISAMMSHVELLWEMRQLREIHERLGRFGRVVQFDRRGAGESDTAPGGVAATYEEWVDDIRAVMDAYDIERASLWAMDTAAPYTLLFAASHPQRVERVVLVEPMVNGVVQPPADTEAIEFVTDLVGQYWGDGISLPTVSPSAASDPVTHDEWARLERYSMSRSLAARTARVLWQIDPSTLLGSVQPSVLIVHGEQYDQADLVDRLPDAQAIGFGGREMHWWLADHRRAAMLDAVEEFLTGHAPAVDERRVLATLLFTDFVGSTERAAAIGDAAWRTVLDRHDELVSLEIERHGGRLVKLTGDGVLAVFEAPARALRCALAVQTGLRSADLTIRAAVHTGEVELRGEDVGGLAVHVASRILGLAGPQEVLASAVVRDLVAGSGLEFADHGTHDLKGVPHACAVVRLKRDSRGSLRPPS